MATSYTPGPWHISELALEMRATDSAGAIFGPFNGGGAPLIADTSRSPGDSQATANGHLIAAAPELLEALEQCAESLNLLACKHGIQFWGASYKSDVPDDYGVYSALTNAKSAIKKALNQ